MLILVGTCQFW